MTLYSDYDKRVAIRNFVFARSKKLAQIKSYYKIRDYLEEGRINILCELKKSGKNKRDTYPYNIISRFYTVEDAQVYFEWLISVANGTRKVTDDLFTKTINQLFMFIFGLDNLDANPKVTLLEPYSLDEEFTNIDEKISKVQNKVNLMDKNILDALQKILDWKQHYEPYLERIKKDQDSFFNNALKRNDNSK